MSNNEYYYEVHRQSYEFGQNFDSDSRLSPDNYESASENFLTDYEIVSNEDVDEDDERCEVAYRELRREKSDTSSIGLFNTFRPKARTAQPLENDRLRMSLSAEKISLKSKAAKINEVYAWRQTEIPIPQHNETVISRECCERKAKAISALDFCPRHRRLFRSKQQKADAERNRQKLYTPINSTIVPINVKNQNSNSNGYSEHKCSEDIRDLPEIVLTSFEQQKPIAEGTSGARSLIAESADVAPIVSPKYEIGPWHKPQPYRSVMLSKMPKPVVPPTPPPMPESKPLTAPPQTPTPLSPAPSASPSASPSPTPANSAFTKTKAKKVTRFCRAPDFKPPEQLNETKIPTATNSPVTASSGKQTDTDTSTSELNSQFGSSTSPESLLDNVLSAASSVSVRSSSLSSTAGSGGSGGSEIRKILNIKQKSKANANASMMRNASNIAQQKRQQQQLANELNDNRSLNSKSSTCTIGLSAKSPSPAVTATTTAAVETLTIPPTSSQLLSSPARTLTPPSPCSVVRALGTTPSPNGEACALLPPEADDDALANRSSPSPSPAASTHNQPNSSLFPDHLKCRICNESFRDPRTLNCLHSFCFQCLVDENFKQDSSIPFWSQPGAGEHDWKASNKSSIPSSSPEMSLRSSSSSPTRQRHSSFSFKRKKSIERILLRVRSKSDGRSSESSFPLRMTPTTNNEPLRHICCNICKYATVIPVGGIRQLQQNFLLVRQIEAIKLKIHEEVLTKVWCSQCYDETNATYHCISCTLNLCTLCKESHERQRNTADHRIRNIVELRHESKQQKQSNVDNAKFTLKCGMHPGFEMKSFCHNCLQVVCADCLVLLHKGHRHESIAKAFNNYSKLLYDAMDHTRPLCNYADHTIERMSEITKEINKRCDDIRSEIETYMRQYLEAVEVHRKTLLQQVHRARETKLEMIVEQKLDLEKRNKETVEALRFAQELSESGSEVEVLSFLNILLKRFEYCQKFKMPTDPKISNTLQFLPDIRAPAMKAQNDIPLYGIITMQIVKPSLCTLQWEGFSELRLNKRVELLLQSRDTDGIGLCHGGLQIQALLKYKDVNTHSLPVEIADNRDGTYGIGFTPDAQGTLVLTININDKPIKGSPFVFLACNLRPHSGIYHCCTFCSSKGNKIVKCSCDGRMPGYNGCGHGHDGHPGRRHWSCCGNVLRNSECTAANKTLNSETSRSYT